MKIRKLMVSMLAMTLMLTGCIPGCGEVVPPGKTIIILHPDGTSTVVDKGVYKSWGRDKVYFVDQKLKSFNEPMKILCADDINMDVDLKAILSFQVTKESIDFIKKKVPEIDGNLSLDQFYKMTVSDIVRSSGRNIISPLITDDIRPNRQRLEAEIFARVVERLKQLKYPLHVSAVLISNIDYPQSVKDMRERIKQAQLKDQESAANAEAQLAETKRQVAIEQELAKVRMIRAQAQADENTILAKSLTPEYLMWRQLEVMEKSAIALAAGASNTVFMMPYKAMDPTMLGNVMVKSSIDQLRNENK